MDGSTEPAPMPAEPAPAEPINAAVGGGGEPVATTSATEAASTTPIETPPVQPIAGLAVFEALFGGRADRSPSGSAQPARPGLTIDELFGGPPKPVLGEATLNAALRKRPIGFVDMGPEMGTRPRPPPTGFYNSEPGASAAPSVGPAVEAAVPARPAKRPRSLKYSAPDTAQQPQARATRRAAALAAGPALSAAAQASNGPVQPVVTGKGPVPNRDYCETCGGKGHFLCCDGCPRSFHFACIEPPLELETDLTTDDSWYCKVCKVERATGGLSSFLARPKTLFGDLIHRAEVEGPRVFRLPPSIQTYFKDVSTGGGGEYVDLRSKRKPGKMGFLEEREPFKTRDRNGKTVLCFKCRKAPSAPLHAVVSCDFCDVHWHLDCLDPPLLTLPPSGHRWMCPLHTEQSTRRARVPKHQSTVTVSSRQVANAGEVDIVLSGHREASPEWEELSVNGVRYQVPEEVVILDFLGALRGELPKPMIRQPAPRKPRARTRGTGRVGAGGRTAPAADAGVDSDGSSPLSSLETSPEPVSVPLVGPTASVSTLAPGSPQQPASSALFDETATRLASESGPLPATGRKSSPSTASNDESGMDIDQPFASSSAPLSTAPVSAPKPPSVRGRGKAPRSRGGRGRGRGASTSTRPAKFNLSEAAGAAPVIGPDGLPVAPAPAPAKRGRSAAASAPPPIGEAANLAAVGAPLGSPALGSDIGGSGNEMAATAMIPVAPASSIPLHMTDSSATNGTLPTHPAPAVNGGGSRATSPSPLRIKLAARPPKAPGAPSPVASPALSSVNGFGAEPSAVPVAGPSTPAPAIGLGLAGPSAPAPTPAAPVVAAAAAPVKRAVVPRKVSMPSSVASSPGASGSSVPKDPLANVPSELRSYFEALINGTAVPALPSPPAVVPPQQPRPRDPLAAVPSELRDYFERLINNSKAKAAQAAKPLSSSAVASGSGASGAAASGSRAVGGASASTAAMRRVSGEPTAPAASTPKPRLSNPVQPPSQLAQATPPVRPPAPAPVPAPATAAAPPSTAAEPTATAAPAPPSPMSALDLLADLAQSHQVPPGSVS